MNSQALAQHSAFGQISPRFAPIVMDLRDAIIEHYEDRSIRLDTPAGLRTLDTNSLLAAGRARLLLRLLAERGSGSVAGRRVLDLGAGFGSLSLYFAHLGAEVVAVDPNGERVQLAETIAQRRGLRLAAVTAWAHGLPFPSGSFDFVVANNSLCYIVDVQQRADALAQTKRVLRPGGWFVARNPNRLHPRDHFSGLPLLPLLRPEWAQRVATARGRSRSYVRLYSPAGAVAELRKAGFVQPHWCPYPDGRVRGTVAGYHHVVARSPGGQPPRRSVLRSLRAAGPRPAPLSGPSRNGATADLPAPPTRHEIATVVTD
jgi:SAM-dependent methyltransferase